MVMFAVQVNEGFLQQLSDLDYKLSWARAQADQAAWQDHQQLTREISNLQNIVFCQKHQYQTVQHGHWPAQLYIQILITSEYVHHM